MTKNFFIVIVVLFCFRLSADLFRIKVEKNDSVSKNTIGMFDVMGSEIDNKGNLIFIVNVSENEVSVFRNLFTDAKEISDDTESDAEYDDLDEINSRMENLESTSEGRVKLFVIGHSIEDREIKALRISKNDSDTDLPEILLVGLHHAREWISYEVPLSIAEFLVENMDSNIYVSNILAKAVIWVAPMLNPDGYVYSRDYERYWRNNKRVNADLTIGVDLNRNYDASWVQSNYTNGTEPFSEPETLAIKQLIENSFKKPLENGIKSLDGLITYHSYGQMILYPPGSTNEPTENSDYYYELGVNMSNIMFSECGSIYLAMQISQLYNTFGEMTEWFMDTHDGKPSFTIELRPPSGNDYNFALPAEQIKDTVKENIVPAIYFMEHVITGETSIVMDSDGNGKNDVIENTRYDYQCDRSDLETLDSDDSSDNDIPENDDNYSESDDISAETGEVTDSDETDSDEMVSDSETTESVPASDDDNIIKSKSDGCAVVIPEE